MFIASGNFCQAAVAGTTSSSPIGDSTL